jgi:hypothetical protein
MAERYIRQNPAKGELVTRRGIEMNRLPRYSKKPVQSQSRDVGWSCRGRRPHRDMLNLALHELLNVHIKLRGHPIDYPRSGGLALARAGHSSPVDAATEHDGLSGHARIEWQQHDLAIRGAVDEHRLTEDGAEAVALAYTHAVGRWLVKRRLRRGEYADWLLQTDDQSLALEISGTTTEDGRGRLKEKREQVARCTLPASRMAVVVAFIQPMILAGTV